MIGRLRRLLGHSLVRISGIYITAQLVQAGLGILLVPLWAHYLTAGDYAVTGTLNAYAQVLGIFLVVGLHAAAGKHAVDLLSKPGELSRYVSSVVSFQLVLSASITGVLAIVGPSLARSPVTAGPELRLMLGAAFFASLSLIPLSLFQHQQRASLNAIGQLSTFLVAALGNLVLVVGLRWGAFGVLTSQLAAAAISSTLLLAVVLRERATLAFEWRHVTAALSYGLPLVPYALFSTVAVTSDRFLLEQYASAELGAYNFAVTLSGVLRVIVVGLNAAWVPYYLALMVGKDPRAEEKIARMVSTYVGGVGGLTLAGILLADPIVRLFFPDRFEPSIPYVPPLLIGHFLMCLAQFAVLPLAHFEANRWFPLIGLASAGTTVALDVWLVPGRGALAAGWIVVAGQLVVLLVGYPIGRRYQPTRFPLWWYVPAIALLVGAGAVASVAPASLPSWARVVGAVLALVLGASVAWRETRAR